MPNIRYAWIYYTAIYRIPREPPLPQHRNTAEPQPQLLASATRSEMIPPFDSRCLLVIEVTLKPITTATEHSQDVTFLLY